MAPHLGANFPSFPGTHRKILTSSIFETTMNKHQHFTFRLHMRVEIVGDMCVQVHEEIHACGVPVGVCAHTLVHANTCVSKAEVNL